MLLQIFDWECTIVGHSDISVSFGHRSITKDEEKKKNWKRKGKGNRKNEEEREKMKKEGKTGERKVSIFGEWMKIRVLEVG